jgi:hypothetical protein
MSDNEKLTESSGRGKFLGSIGVYLLARLNRLYPEEINLFSKIYVSKRKMWQTLLYQR